MYATGIWRGEIVRRLHVHNSPRYFAPPVLVVATVFAVSLLPFRRLRRLAIVAGLGPGAYTGVLAALSARSGGSLLDRLRYAAVLATMHYGWGAGFVKGLLRGAGDTVDTSRHG